MRILYEKSFLKDIQKLDPKIREGCKKSILEIKSFRLQSEIPNLKKLTGYKNYYRIRIGDYRIGCKIENEIITLIRFQHRGNIYKVFP